MLQIWILLLLVVIVSGGYGCRQYKHDAFSGYIYIVGQGKIECRMEITGPEASSDLNIELTGDVLEPSDCDILLEMYGSDKNYTKWTKCKQLKGLQLISHVSRVEIHLSMISASSVDMLVKWNAVATHTTALSWYDAHNTCKEAGGEIAAFRDVDMYRDIMTTRQLFDIWYGRHAHTWTRVRGCFVIPRQVQKSTRFRYSQSAENCLRICNQSLFFGLEVRPGRNFYCLCFDDYPGVEVNWEYCLFSTLQLRVVKLYSNDKCIRHKDVCYALQEHNTTKHGGLPVGETQICKDNVYWKLDAFDKTAVGCITIEQDEQNDAHQCLAIEKDSTGHAYLKQISCSVKLNSFCNGVLNTNEPMDMKSAEKHCSNKKSFIVPPNISQLSSGMYWTGYFRKDLENGAQELPQTQEGCYKLVLNNSMPTIAIENCSEALPFICTVPLESRMDSLLTTRQPTSSTPDEVKREEDTGQSNSLDKKNSLPGHRLLILLIGIILLPVGIVSIILWIHIGYRRRQPGRRNDDKFQTNNRKRQQECKETLPDISNKDKNQTNNATTTTNKYLDFVSSNGQVKNNTTQRGSKTDDVYPSTFKNNSMNVQKRPVRLYKLQHCNENGEKNNGKDWNRFSPGLEGSQHFEENKGIVATGDEKASRNSAYASNKRQYINSHRQDLEKCDPRKKSPLENQSVSHRFDQTDRSEQANEFQTDEAAAISNRFKDKEKEVIISLESGKLLDKKNTSVGAKQSELSSYERFSVEGQSYSDAMEQIQGNLHTDLDAFSDTSHTQPKQLFKSIVNNPESSISSRGTTEHLDVLEILEDAEELPVESGNHMDYLK